MAALLLHLTGYPIRVLVGTKPPPRPLLTILSQVVFPAITTVSSYLKNAAFLDPGELHKTKIFHRGQPYLYFEPCLPKYGGQICHSLSPKYFLSSLP